MGRTIPEDQLEEAAAELGKKAAKAQASRPDQANRYRETAGALDSVVKDENGISSKGLSREGSKQLTRDVKGKSLDLSEYGISSDQLVKLEHVMKSSLKAGTTAAMVAMALRAAPAIVNTLQQFASEGEVSFEDLFSEGAETAQAGAKGFVAGAFSAAVTESLQAGLLGDSLKCASPEVAAAIVVVAIDAAINGWKVAKGEMSGLEFAEATFKQSYLTMFTLAGGALMQEAIPIPVAGYMLGSLIGSILGGLSYEVGATVFTSVCVEGGLTFFGLVEQDYSVPAEVLHQLGLDVIELDVFAPVELDFDLFEPDRIELDTFLPQVLEMNVFQQDLLSEDGLRQAQVHITSLRRGVVGFGKVGYI